MRGDRVVTETLRPTRQAGRLRAALLGAVATAERRALLAILALSAALNCWALPREGWGNEFYAASVRSMLDSWHNVFFSAFDPGGFLAISKPPLGFTLQTLFAKVLGFSGVALILPQALAGVASVALLYHLIRRAHGPLAGLAAALALATTPIFVATARNNTVDLQVVLVSLCAVWAAQHAAECGRFRPLALCAALIGIGFLIKFSAALLVAPACAAVYALSAPVAWIVRLRRLALAGCLLAVICAAWILAVDAVPQSSRPYIFDSVDGTELSVVLNANGLERLLPRAAHHTAVAPVASSNPAVRSVTYPEVAAAGNAGEVGPPGPLRLLGGPLAGQIAWLLPLALIGLIGGAIALYRARRGWSTARGAAGLQSALLWSVWLLCGLALFSVAGFFHRYYLVIVAPPIAAMAGIAVGWLWRSFRREGRSLSACMLPAALLSAAEVQLLIIEPHPAYARALLPLLGLACALPALILLVLRWPSTRWTFAISRPAQAGLATMAMLVLAVGPVAWSLVPVLHGGAGEVPFAAPELTASPRSAVLPDGYPRDADPGLLAYLRAHHDGERYWLATFGTVTAAPVILDLNRPVMELGGFVGGDQTGDAAALRRHIARGEVRFFLLPDISGIRPAFGQGVTPGTAEAVNWVRGTCSPIAASAWRTRPDPLASPTIDPYYTLISGGSLYDCAGAAH